MLKANREPLNCLPNRHRSFCAILASLVLSGTFLSCHPTPERVADSLTAGRSPRPIDADPHCVEITGQEALAKIGYIPIMNLARDAGWVTRKKRESARISDPALLAQAASGFVVVFTEYAVAAGVASQADSPAPGPGDVAAIGILVVGLIDAGLLEGAILVSLGELVGAMANSTTSAPPVTITMPTATAAPTTTAAPIATWVPVTQVETDEETERCNKVKAECLEYCNHRMGQGYRPPQPGKKGRGRAGGGTNDQTDHRNCYNECKAKHGCK